MSSIKHTLAEEVFAVFKRACREKDFALADHLLAALEAVAYREKDVWQLDLAYLVLAASCEGGDASSERPQSRHWDEAKPPTLGTM